MEKRSSCWDSAESYPSSLAAPAPGLELPSWGPLVGQLFPPPAAPARPPAAERQDSAGGSARAQVRRGWAAASRPGPAGHSPGAFRLAGHLPRFSSPPPALVISPSAPFLAASEPSPDVLPPQRQGVLLAVQLAHGGAAAGRSPGLPFACARLPREPAGCLRRDPSWGRLALGVGSHRWHQLAGVIPF